MHFSTKLTMHKTLGLGLIILACALWAVDTLIRYPLIYKGISASHIVFIEHLILSAFFVLFYFRSFKSFLSSGKSIFYFLFLGSIGSAWATIAFTKAFTYLNPSLVILLQKFQPVFAIVLARVMLKEEIKKGFIGWALVCLAGALLISYQDLSRVLSAPQEIFVSSSTLMGYGLVLFSVLGWGAATVVGKKLTLLGFSNQEIMSGRFFTGLLAILPFILVSEKFGPYDVNIYTDILLMVLLSGLIAMFVYYKGLKRISAHSATLGEMFFPLMAILVNWLFLDKSLQLTQILGGAVLVAGSIVIQLKRY